MFVCSSTVSGFKGIVGPLSTHIGMLIAMLFVPRDVFTKDWDMCFFLHIAMICVSLINLYVTQNTQLFSQIITFLGMSGYILVYLQLSIQLTSNWDKFIADQTSGTLTDDAKTAINWYLIEVLTLVAFILSYMLIIFVRFFFKVRFHINDEKRCFEPGTDFIEVEATSFQFYITMAAPLFVTAFQVTLNNNYHFVDDADYASMLNTQIVFQSIQIASFLWVLFADMRSGSVQKKRLTVQSAVVAAAISIYLIPIIQWIIIFANWDVFGCWSTCIGFTSLALMIHASILIVPVIIGLYQQMPPEGFPDRESTPFNKQLRGDGDGDIRLGTSFELREDMYALSVLCYLQDATLDEAFKFKEDREMRLNEVGIKANNKEEDKAEPDENDDDFKKVEDAAGVSDSRKMQDRFYQNKRAKNASTAFIVWTFQFTISSLLMRDVMDQQDAFSCTAPLANNYVRFVCALMLHLQLQDEIKQGLDIMKYTNNHAEKFKNWWIPFMLGFFQTSMVALIELVNLVNICANIAIMNIVMNYVALAVVADFDDYIFEAIKRGNKICALFEEDLLEIEITTSSNCTHEEDIQKLITFSQRSCGNKIARLVYKFWRLMYVMIYFYFFEFITLILIFIFPIINRSFAVGQPEGYCDQF